MHLPTFDNIQDWISTGGYFVLFGLLFACGLGMPLPEDVPLIIAGALIANGKMHLIVAAVVAWCGIIGGDCMLYTFGHKFGLNITKVPLIGGHLTQARIERVEVLFEKYGIGAIFVGRMFAGVRGAMVVAAGTIRYNFAKFIIADGLGAVVSGGFFLFVGHFLGRNLTKERAEHFKYWFIAGAAIAAVLFAAYLWWRRKHRTPSEEVAKVMAGEGR